MLDGPIGAAAFNNEYGRPALGGYFRTFEAAADGASNRYWGYHKPVMIAGGVGNVRAEHVEAADVPVGARLIVLGGPAMLIGLGGGAASSMASGESDSELDFASVQRDNAEMQRRCQEVIDRCWALGAANPIRLIHDVGAGGLSNALPELVSDAGRGGRFELRDVPSADGAMSPMEIWCNEAQERYVMAVADGDLPRFREICERERCPYAVVGTAQAESRLTVTDRDLDDVPVDLPLATLLGKPPAMHRSFARRPRAAAAPDLAGVALPGCARACAAVPRGRFEEVPRHDRRPQHHRARGSGPDGRAVPGPGGRRRRDPRRLRRLTPVRRWRWGSGPRSPWWTRPPPRAWPWRKR